MPSVEQNILKQFSDSSISRNHTTKAGMFLRHAILCGTLRRPVHSDTSPPCICIGSHFPNMHRKSFSVKYFCAIYCSSSLQFICFQRNKMSISVFWATYLPSCFPRDEHGVCLLHRNAKRYCTKKTVGAFLAIDRTDFLPIDFSRPGLIFSSNSVQLVPAKSSMEYAH